LPRGGFLGSEGTRSASRDSSFCLSDSQAKLIQPLQSRKHNTDNVLVTSDLDFSIYLTAIF
jgi:hypothetical protein